MSATANYGLVKPDVGSTGWGGDVNGNFDRIDEGMARNADNIALAAFRIAVAGGFSKFSLEDGFADEFEDQSGVDAAASSGQTYNSSGRYFFAPKNYFGSGADGDAAVSSDTDIPSVQDGDMAVKNYNSLTINAGSTLTLQNRCRGLLVYVRGNCTINGRLSATARGANADPVAAGVGPDGIRLPMLKSGETETLSGADFSGCGSAAVNAAAHQGGISGNGKIFSISRSGASGGAGGSPGNPHGGGNGTGGQSGGGGGGIASSGTAGAGAAGTCFSGGPGGGGGSGGTAGSPNGGTGGEGKPNSNAGGGAGNPGGAGVLQNGENGTGGLLILIVKGDLTIGPSGIIEADGKRGGAIGTTSEGGGSGGGSILCLCSGTFSNNGTIRASGGQQTNSGSGGAGSVQASNVDGATAGNFTLVSNSAEAEAEPVSARLVLLVEGEGVVLNTDISAYVSLDDGANWEQVALSDEGSFDSTRRIIAGTRSLTDRDDKTMRVKVATANDREIRLHAWSCMWR